LLDLLDELAVAADTVVVFAGDNGPEEILTWRGTPGYWEGSYFAGGEGNLRTPCSARWPGRTRKGEVSDEIMHVTDWFTTLLHAAGVSEPDDRVIDGVDQLDWLTAKAESSQREGYVYWMGREMYGAKWRNFKLVLVAQRYSTDPPAKAGLAADHQPHRRPAGARAHERGVPPLLDRGALQPAARRVRGEREARAADPDGRAARPRAPTT
jgi:arylsulfatase A-like enzyme